MKTMTRYERVQPTCAGVDERGELRWQACEMAEWQANQIWNLVKHVSDLFAHWVELSIFEETQKDFNEESRLLPSMSFKSKSYISTIRRMYHQGKKWYTVSGE